MLGQMLRAEPLKHPAQARKGSLSLTSLLAEPGGFGGRWTSFNHESGFHAAGLFSRRFQAPFRVA